jgi:hypothetical protein
MPEHFTRSTVSAAFYCKKCERETQHRIDDRRKGPCLECMARLERQHEAPKQLEMELSAGAGAAVFSPESTNRAGDVSSTRFSRPATMTAGMPALNPVSREGIPWTELRS